jgi:hypothetical protein
MRSLPLLDMLVAMEWWSPARLSMLAVNLVIAAGLCRAFEDGWEERETWDLYGQHGYRLDRCWRPGCGRQT